MDVQKRFKPWYNQLFPHQQQCQQRLDYDYADGPLCSCSYRPCKSSIDRWSLSSAIAYTFGGFLHESCVDVTRCSAITKLALAIDEGWTNEQVSNYVEKRKVAYEVNDSSSSMSMMISSFHFLKEEWVHLFSWISKRTVPWTKSIKKYLRFSFHSIERDSIPSFHFFFYSR